MQSSQHPQKHFHQYETGPLDHHVGKSLPHFQKKQQAIEFENTGGHKPSPSYGGNTSYNKGQEGRSGDGEKSINKRHQMRMTTNDSKRGSPHHNNITRSLIDEGSEDFTNIEEHIQEDTRISCRNAVASSLHNVSVLIKQQVNQAKIRNRRGTTQSNMSGPSGQVSKEETFETSSFFDEGAPTNRPIQSMNGSISPHKCNQVEGYNLPTIFNTLMFGIDQTKVCDRVRESFSKIHGRPQSRVSQHNNASKQQTPRNTQGRMSNNPKAYIIEETKQIQQLRKNESNAQSKSKLSQLVTKVDKSPIMVFDQHQQQTGNNRNLKNQNQVNKDNLKQTTTSQKAQPKTMSPAGGRHSQLQFVAQQNLAIEQQIDPPESLHTEVLDKKQIESEFNQDIYDVDEDQEQEADLIAQSTSNQIDDFQSSELHRNHLIQTLQSLQYIKTLPPVNKNEIHSRTVKLPPMRNSSIKKTLIFDLDETLVHCIDDIENNSCDQIINVTFPNGETVQAGINIRPYAIECLQKANENYQVVVFTASHKAYADVVLDYLDPTRSLIQYRLYRDHCIRTEEGIYIKDLRIISNRHLRDLIIVDNAVYSFGYQLDNGIPIIPFYDDKNDEELMHLIFYFNCLAQCDDVRDQNRKAFQLKDLQEIDIAEYLQSMMNQANGGNQEEEEEE